jgi:hypothetical protein
MVPHRLTPPRKSSGQGATLASAPMRDENNDPLSMVLRTVSTLRSRKSSSGRKICHVERSETSSSGKSYLVDPSHMMLRMTRSYIRYTIPLHKLFTGGLCSAQTAPTLSFRRGDPSCSARLARSVLELACSMVLRTTSKLRSCKRCSE